jgi:hypothetical protein
MRVIFSAILAGLVASCTSARMPESAQLAPSPEMTKARANIGKTFWVSPKAPFGIPVCNDRDATPLPPKCPDVKEGKFVVQAVDTRMMHLAGTLTSVPGLLVYKVAFENGRTGYIDHLDLEYNTTKVDPARAAAECRRRGSPRIGMTTDQVIATCWGRPEKVNRTETGNTIFDQCRLLWRALRLSA